jgi:hypothetical protein
VSELYSVQLVHSGPLNPQSLNAVRSQALVSPPKMLVDSLVENECSSMCGSELQQPNGVLPPGESGGISSTIGGPATPIHQAVGKCTLPRYFTPRATAKSSKFALGSHLRAHATQNIGSG